MTERTITVEDLPAEFERLAAMAISPSHTNIWNSAADMLRAALSSDHQGGPDLDGLEEAIAIAERAGAGVTSLAPSVAATLREGFDRLREVEAERDAAIEESDQLKAAHRQAEQQQRTIYVCPGESCAFFSMTPGRCRSHPYPARAVGPTLVPTAASFAAAAKGGESR